MTLEQLHTLAHDIAYACARSDIECFTRWRDDRTSSPTEPSFAVPAHRWYDLSTVIRSDYERECVARAIFYLDARSLLLRKPGAPFMVQILNPLSDGALMPPALAEVATA